jgi:hypothetical protein
MKRILLSALLSLAIGYGANAQTSNDFSGRSLAFAGESKWSLNHKASQGLGVTGLQSLNSLKDDDDHHDFFGGYFGIRFMPTIASLSYMKSENGVVSSTFVVGYGFGALIGINASDHVGFQGEVIYSQLAQKYKEANTDIERQVKLNYVNVPVLLVLNTGFSHAVNFNVCAGPQVGFNTGAKIETASDNHSNADTVHAVLAVKPADVGIAYGAGIDFGTAVKFSLGFRGVYGLVDVSDRSQSITTNEYYVLDRSHVKTYSAYAGLTFAF